MIKYVRTRYIVELRNNALGLYMDLGLTKSKYIILRQYNAKHNKPNTYYPSYENIAKAKMDCYPINIEITETGASIKLQNLLDHTLYRLIQALTPNENRLLDGKQLIFKWKWGMDGASGQQNFKMSGNDDSSIFMLMVVPLQAVSDEDVVKLFGKIINVQPAYADQ